MPIKENLEVTVKTIVSIQTPDKQQEIKEPSTIREFVYSMLALDKTEYDTAYKMLAPLVKLDLNFDCFSCDFKGDVEVPLTPEFFGLPQKEQKQITMKSSCLLIKEILEGLLNYIICQPPFAFSL